MPLLVDPKELRLRMFFEGVTDEMIKNAEYLDEPVAFFTGCYEELRTWFGGALPAGKTASAHESYPDYVADCCRKFVRKNTLMKAAAHGTLDKVAAAMGMGNTQLGPIGGAGTDLVKGVEQAQQDQMNQSGVTGVSPERMERRQDIIDALMPQAEQIGLKPDGEIKIKMPQPDNAGVTGPQVPQAEGAAEMLSQQDPNVAQAEQASAEQMGAGGEPDPAMGGAGGGGDEEAQLMQMLGGEGGAEGAAGANEAAGMMGGGGMDPAQTEAIASARDQAGAVGGGGGMPDGAGETMPGMDGMDPRGAEDPSMVDPMEGGEMDEQSMIQALMNGGSEGKMAMAKVYQLTTAGL